MSVFNIQTSIEGTKIPNIYKVHVNYPITPDILGRVRAVPGVAQAVLLDKYTFKLLTHENADEEKVADGVAVTISLQAENEIIHSN